MDYQTVFSSDLGWMGALISPIGLRQLVFDHPSPRSAQLAIGAVKSGAVKSEWSDDELLESGLLESEFLEDDDPRVDDVVERLIRFARGDDDSLHEIPIDLSGLTRFQTRVLKVCRRIPRGETCTYAQVARTAGSPNAARAVGSVMSRNRIPLVIPCHRVVRSGGMLGGFSSRSGLRMKRRLLRMEQESVAEVA